MASLSFDSYSQNGEDVVLWRALQHVASGRYIDVGANDPVADSVSWAFYDRGWSGITIEPDPQYAQLQRQLRPRDLLVEAAIAATDGATITLHVVDETGLSTVKDDLVKLHAEAGRETHDVTVPTRRLDRILQDAGWSGEDIHFMSVDTEGSEREVLQSIDLSTWRPWIMVIEATAPTSTEPTHEEWESIVTSQGYRFCLFDGLSRWYVSEEHGELSDALGYPASVLDDFTTLQSRQYVQQIAEMRSDLQNRAQEIVRWRSEALTKWGAIVADKRSIVNLRTELQALQGAHHEINQLCHQFSLQNAALANQIRELQQSTSWRITRPVRAARGRLGRLRRPR